MRIVRSITYILVIYILISNLTFAQIKNTIIAKVGNQIITSLDVENEVKAILILTKTEVNRENIEKIKKKSIQSLIRKSIKKIEIEKYNIKDFSIIELENYSKNMAKNLNVSTSDLKKIFLENNIDYDLYIDNYKTDLLWNTLIFQLYNSKINLNPIEIENILKREIDKDRVFKEFNLSEIEIPLDKNEDYISGIYNSIKINGFDVTVQKYSISESAINNGSIGWVSEKSLNRIFLSVINNLNVNDVSKPIKHLESQVIFKLNDIKVNKSGEFDLKKLKENIVFQMKNEKLNLYSRSHFTNVKNQTLVDFK